MVMTWKSERDGLRRQDAERASRHMQTNTWSDVKHVATHRVYHESETVPEGTAHGESETNPVSDREREPASSSQPPSQPAQTETMHTPVK